MKPPYLIRNLILATQLACAVLWAGGDTNPRRIVDARCPTILAAAAALLPENQIGPIHTFSPDHGRYENVWGYAIPGLSMNASELPQIAGLYRANNPGVNGTPAWDRSYSMEELAYAHAQAIQRVAANADPNKPFYVMGMSMGGMVTSILATEYRHMLPRNTQFVFLVTSPNLSSNPAVPDAIMQSWFSVRTPEAFQSILAPFISADFHRTNPAAVQTYYQYRINRGNQQPSTQFARQVEAVRAFDGARYFSQVNPEEATFIGGNQDGVLGTSHNQNLRDLVPGARHIEVSGLGHMVNIENPALFIPESRRNQNRESGR